MSTEIYSRIRSKFSLFDKNNINTNIILPPDNMYWDDIQSCIVYDKINKTCIFDKKRYQEHKDGIIGIHTYSPKDNLQYVDIIIDPLLAQFILMDIFGKLGGYNAGGKKMICSLIHNETNTCFNLCEFHNVFEPLNPFFIIVTPYNNIETTPKSFIDDFIFLLNFLCNHQQEYKVRCRKYCEDKFRSYF